MRLEGEVAIVTGGGRGIGKSTALMLAKDGAKIVICSRTVKELEETRKEIENSGGEVLAVKTDVSDKKDVKNLVQRTLSKLGKIDILVNNAGVAISKPLIETTEKEWNSIIDTNLKGPYLCSTEVLPHMIKQKKGVIVNISSGAGKYGFADLAAYCASKFGLIGLTESLAKEVDRQGIRVYAVCPGAVNTKMQGDVGSVLPSIARLLMLQPEDIARKIVPLCYSDCRIRTGSSIEVYLKS